VSRRFLGGLVGAGVGALAYAALVERRWYALRHVTVPVLRPAAARPLRVLHLSDLHLLPWQDDALAFVAACAETAPDVVVATGDLLGHPDAVEPVVAALAELGRGRLALAVLGSNDFYGPRPKNPALYLYAHQRRIHGPRLDTAALVDGLADAGWQVLENRRQCPSTPAGLVDVAGFGDPHIRRDHPERIDWTAPAEAVALRLGVVHAPYRRALDVFAHHGYDLVLAGHTHGGQLRLPGVGALVTNCDLPTWRARGLTRVDAEPWLHVSAGLGTSRYAPVRFACRPEASVLDLVAVRPAD
jgi:predicted MPP superfamily phosphohydrolase